MLSSRGRFTEALAELERAEQTNADAHQEVLRGIILRQMGKNHEPLTAYRHAVWPDPTLSSPQQDSGSLNKSRSRQGQQPMH